MSLHWAAFGAYCVAALALGIWSGRKTDSGQTFWTAGRNLGAGSVGLSISAGFMSVSWSCVYAVQLFFWYGLGGLWLVTVPWLISLVGIAVLAGRYHQLPAFSQGDMVAHRFGSNARVPVALALAFVFLVWGGAEIYVAARLLAPGLALSLEAMILLIGLVVGVYATMGGFRAVVSTDKLQFILVAIYMLIMGLLAARGLWQQQGRLLPPTSLAGYKSGVSWAQLFAPGASIICLTFLAYLPGWLFETDLWLRVQAARDQKAARWGVAISGINAVVFVGILPLFIGVAALALFPQGGPGAVDLGAEGDAIFAALVLRYAPEWVAALVGVGLVAAAMSTIDTCINIMALSLAYDLAGAHQRPEGARLAKWFTLGSTAACVLFAMNTESLWDIFYLSSGILTTSVAFPVAAVVFWPKLPRAGVMGSSVMGFVGTVSAYFLEKRPWFFQTLEPQWLVDSSLGFIFWGALAAFLGYALMTLVSRGRPSDPRTRFP